MRNRRDLCERVKEIDWNTGSVKEIEGCDGVNCERIRVQTLTYICNHNNSKKRNQIVANGLYYLNRSDLSLIQTFSLCNDNFDEQGN